MAIEEQKDVKEERIRALTKIYYSNPKLQQYLLEFGRNREVVPRYYEGFGKRPDMIQYPSDIIGLVQKGATSMHCSEELWHDPLQIQSAMSPQEMNDLRKSWDLLIDIDSPFLDFSKVACQLACQELEDQGIKEYGIKYSGSKGFHIIVSGDAFPEEFQGQKRNECFPAWPRAIVGYLMSKIKPEYGRKLKAMDINLAALQIRTKLKESDITEFLCPNCHLPVNPTLKVTMHCKDCGTTVERPNMTVTKRVLRCTNCPGILDIVKQEPYYFCQNCGTKSVDLRQGSDDGGTIVLSRAAKEQSKQYSVDFEKTIAGEKVGEFDMVLVAPRHLFRMPYSLHEKTSLSSVVIDKTQIAGFTPKDAQPLSIELKEYMKKPKPDCGTELLRRALEWKAKQEEQLMQSYNAAAQAPGANRVPTSSKKEYAQRDYSHLTEKDFPQSVQKLLKGLDDGKKRGLFVLITFLRSIGYAKEKTDVIVRQWNEKNKQPLREGYVRSQVEWHYKQRKQILPPNYENDAFYKDIGLFEKRPNAKNPLSEIASKARFKEN
jgi:hypothetical protein